MMFICFAATSSDMSFEQAPVNEIHICLICGRVGAKWRELGTALGLESALMDAIEDNHSSYREKARKVLHEWKKNKKSGATVGILIKALEKIQGEDIVKTLGGM